VMRESRKKVVVVILIWSSFDWCLVAWSKKSCGEGAKEDWFSGWQASQSLSVEAAPPAAGAGSCCRGEDHFAERSVHFSP